MEKIVSRDRTYMGGKWVRQKQMVNGFFINLIYKARKTISCKLFA